MNFTKSIYYTWPGPNWFKNLFISLDMLLDRRSFFKILSTRFSWLTAKFKIPSFFRLGFSDFCMSFRRFSILTGEIFVLFTSPKHLEAPSKVEMLTCHLQLKVKSKTECPFLMYRLFVKIKHLPLLSNGNLSLVEFIQILTASYHLAISLVLFTHSLIDASNFI